jgi:hypothetical protein
LQIEVRKTQTQNAKRKTQNAKCKTQNAKRKMQNAKWKTQNAKHKTHCHTLSYVSKTFRELYKLKKTILKYPIVIKYL